MNSDKKNVVFLFGAGASIPAGGLSTELITSSLLNEINRSTVENIKDNPKFILSREWLEMLWKLVNRTAQHDEEVINPILQKTFEPNFENLAFAIEELDDNFNYLALHKTPFDYANLLSTVSKDYYGYRSVEAASHVIVRLKRELNEANPFNQMVQIKSYPGFYGTLNTISKYIRSLFPEKYTVNHLSQLQNIINKDEVNLVVATTNYDLVFEQYFTENNIQYDDGFSRNSEVGHWTGFDTKSQGIKLLKLHGSFNWHRIMPDWFKDESAKTSINNIYRIRNNIAEALLKEDIIVKEKNSVAQDILVPHIIIGGVKDRKSLEIPFIEVQLSWQNAIHNANTIVLVGSSGNDTHLLKHLKALLLTNKRLEKIVIISPSEQAFQNNLAFLGPLQQNNNVKVFCLKAYWGEDEIYKELDISLNDILVNDNQSILEKFSKKE